MPEEPKQRIGFIATSLMLITAIILDALQFLVVFIPGVGQVIEFFITIIALAVFGLWFALMGVNYFSGERKGAKVISMLGSSVIELIPVLDALPGITFGVLGIISATKKEDAAKKLEFDEQVMQFNEQRQGRQQTWAQNYRDVERLDNSNRENEGDEEAEFEKV